MDGSRGKQLTPLAATVLLADKRGAVQGAGTLVSWGGGRSLQTVLCTVKGSLVSTDGILIGRCGTAVGGCVFRPLQEIVTGPAIGVGHDLEITRVDKHATGGAGWHLRDCADGRAWSVGEIADGTPVFLPGVACLDDPEETSGVLLSGYVAGSALSGDGDASGRLLVGGARGRVLAGTPVFARRGGGDSGLLLIGFVDGTTMTSAALNGVIPIAELLASSETWKRAAVGALPNLNWAGCMPGEYKIHPRVAEFLAENASSGRFSKATITARRQDLLNLDRWARSRGLDLATMEDQYLALYFEERAAQGRRATTLIRERGTIERFFEYLVSRGARANGSECPEVSDDEQYRPKTILSVREVQRVLDFEGLSRATAARDRAIVELMYGTGLRAKELATLRMAQIDLSKGILHMPERREGARELALNEPVRKALKNYLRSIGMPSSLRTDELVFRNPRGSALTRQTIGKILVQRAAAAGIKKDVTGMTLRDSAASHLLARGFDREGVAQFLGLASTRDVQRYLPPRARQQVGHAN